MNAINQLATELLYSKVFFLVVSVVGIGFIIYAVTQPIGTLLSVIQHFTKGTDLKNEFIIPQKWFGIYFFAFLTTCLIFREMEQMNIVYSLVVFIGCVSLFLTAYRRFVTEKK